MGRHRELEEDLEIWRNALERRGLKVSRSKTEYLRVGGGDDGKKLKLQEEKVKKAKNFCQQANLPADRISVSHKPFAVCGLQ